MQTTKFYMYQIEMAVRSDSEATCLGDILDKASYPLKALTKNDNKFNIDGTITKSGKIYSGIFCLVQTNDLPPGATLGGGSRPLPLQEDEGLGHYTAFFYDRSMGIILIQSNRNGVNANEIVKFIRINFTEVTKLQLKVIINPSDLLKLQRMTEIRKVELTIAGVKGGGLLANEKVKRSFGELNQITDKTGAENINITLGMGYADGSLKKRPIQMLLNRLRRVDQHGDIIKMQVSGRDEDSDTIKVIDFITNKVVIEVTVEKTRHMNTLVLKRAIDAAIIEYDIIRPEIETTYKIKGEY